MDNISRFSLSIRKKYDYKNNIEKYRKYPIDSEQVDIYECTLDDIFDVFNFSYFKTKNTLDENGFEIIEDKKAISVTNKFAHATCVANDSYGNEVTIDIFVEEYLNE